MTEVSLIHSSHLALTAAFSNGSIFRIQLSDTLYSVCIDYLLVWYIDISKAFFSFIIFKYPYVYIDLCEHSFFVEGIHHGVIVVPFIFSTLVESE